MTKIEHNQTREAGKVPVVWYYVLTVCLSLIFNWFVQYSYYIFESVRDPHAFSGERTLVDYRTGFIGDLILLPIINCLILYIILRSKFRFTRSGYFYLATAGLIADILLHFFQGYLRLTNWSMPSPFRWDFVGYWHMFSFFFQISFVILFLYLALTGIYKKSEPILRATQSVVALMTTFIVLFLYDYVPMTSLTAKVLAELHYLIR